MLVFVLVHRVFVLVQGVFVLVHRVFVLVHGVFVLVHGIFVLVHGVFVLVHRVFVLVQEVLGLRSSFLGLRFSNTRVAFAVLSEVPSAPRFLVDVLSSPSLFTLNLKSAFSRVFSTQRTSFLRRYLPCFTFQTEIRGICAKTFFTTASAIISYFARKGELLFTNSDQIEADRLCELSKKEKKSVHYMNI